MTVLAGRWYLGGPMTNLPQQNFPAFDAAAHDLRGRFLPDDFVLISPAELDDEATREDALADKTGKQYDTPEASRWGEFLARDVQLLADGNIDGMIVLPGWQRSRGARLESFIVAGLMGKPILRYPTLDPVHWLSLMLAWVGPLMDHDRPTASTK